MDKKEKILEFMNDKQYVPMKLKEMAQVLMVPKEEMHKFKEVLDDLESEYKIRKNHKNKYILMDNLYVQGTFRANQKGFGFVKTDMYDDEIYISPEKTFTALNGDIVLVKILDNQDENKSKEGKIVKIIKREIEKVIGTFKNSRNFGFVIPDDKKIGTDIYISKEQKTIKRL